MLDTLGKRLAQARRAMGVREHRDISRIELAKAAGVDSSMVSQYEADTKTPREDTLSRLADFLGVTPAWLRYGVGEVATAPSAAPDYIGGRHLTADDTARARAARDAERASTSEPAKKPARKASGRKRG